MHKLSIKFQIYHTSPANNRFSNQNSTQPVKMISQDRFVLLQGEVTVPFLNRGRTSQVIRFDEF